MNNFKFFLLIVLLFVSCRSAKDDPFILQRENMVREQIASRGVTDEKVIKAMLKVKRHLFVPVNMRQFSYEDSPAPIGYNQTISQPYIVGYMTDVLDIQPDDKVLEIGTGSGYQAAILAELAQEVYSVEIIKELALSADKRLKSLGYANIKVLHGDGYKGWLKHAPFDAIIVTAAPKAMPEKLIQQLKVGGRMVIPIGSFYQDLYLITKREQGIEKKRLFPVIFVPMVHEKN